MNTELLNILLGLVSSLHNASDSGAFEQLNTKVYAIERAVQKVVELYFNACDCKHGCPVCKHSGYVPK